MRTDRRHLYIYFFHNKMTDDYLTRTGVKCHYRIIRTSVTKLKSKPIHTFNRCKPVTKRRFSCWEWQ